MFPGVGLRACPVEGQATESLVVVPLNGDRMNVCKQLRDQTSWLSRLAGAGGLLGSGGGNGSLDQITTYE
jgi:hypothetical protein